MPENDFLLNTFLERWNEYDVEGIVELYCPGATMIDPALERPIQGHAALRDYYERQWKAVQSARLERLAAASWQRTVAWLWSYSGQWNGNRFAILGASHFVVDGGFIAMDQAIWDSDLLAGDGKQKEASGPA